MPTYATALPGQPVKSFRPPTIAGTVRAAYKGPVGRLGRRALAKVNADEAIDTALFAMKTTLNKGGTVDPFAAPPQDKDLLAILSSEFEFRSNLLPEWTSPPIGSDEALNRMSRWMSEAGFVIPRWP